MNKFIIAFEHFDTGGLQTMMVRIGAWCSANAIPCLIIYQTIDDNMKQLSLENRLDMVRASKKGEITKIIKEKISKEDNVVFLTFEIQDFIFYEKIRKYFLSKKYNIKHLYYSVSVGSLIRGKNFKGKTGKIVYNLYSRIVSKYYNNKNIFFMDDDTKKAAVHYFGLDGSIDNVLLLPMFISDMPSLLYPEKRKIMTVTRADFPFKGYVIGLIKDFEQILSRHQDAILIIVTTGKDLEQIKKAIFDCNAKKNIILYESLSISEIRKLLLESFVYIGMGTTVLDAASCAIPSIVVYHNTMKNMSCGMFHSNPRVIGENGQDVDGKPAIKEIEKMYMIGKKEYLQLRESTYNSFKLNYDIDNFMDKLINFNVKDNGVLINTRDYIQHRLVYYLRAVRRVIKHLD